MTKKQSLILPVLLAVASLFSSFPARASVQPREIGNSADLTLALRKLRVLGSALYLAAHPDDENTALLSYWSREKLYRTAYLSMTRGDGGQNLIGTEKGELLGLIRTEELLAARRIDGAEQAFTRAVDFGYSKNPEETLAIWGKDQILADVVFVIRKLRPDVIVTRFGTDGSGGHGHHTASALLAEEAFRAAGDPGRFPEQLRYVAPWQPKRIFWNTWRPKLDGRAAGSAPLLTVDLGTFNPFLGKSYSEIAADSRSMHKSQGFGSAERRGILVNYFEPTGGAAAERDLFDGVDCSWSRVDGGEVVDSILARAEKLFDPADPSKTVPALLTAYVEMGRLGDDPWVKIKRRETLELIRSCAGLWLEAIPSRQSATAGSELSLAATAVNRSKLPFHLDRIEIPETNRNQVVDCPLLDNRPAAAELSIRIPSGAEPSNPYWLASAPKKGVFQIGDAAMAGLADNPPPLTARFHLRIFGESIALDVPAVFRTTDPVEGERYRPFEIAPAVTANIDQKALLFPDRKSKSVRVSLHAEAPLHGGHLRLSAPAGWSVNPASAAVDFGKPGEERSFSFDVTPPAASSSGILAAEVSVGAETFSRSRVTIRHAHIPERTLFPPAESKLVRIDLATRGHFVGYVMGSGDEIPESLKQAGFDVTLLSDEDLDSKDLSRFDAIVVGVRALNTRPRLSRQLPKLLEYVEKGGSLVVQYNTLDDDVSGNFGPYPFQISRDRVTVEEAPVTFLDPRHPLLTTPNEITASDFEGWVQERGLYFPNKWDSRYEAVLSCHDPEEPERKGGILFARYGKGTFVYTGYSWFRELPAGVPGAYRIFANLLAGGRRDGH